MPGKTLRIFKILTGVSFLLLIVNFGDKLWLLMSLTLLVNMLAGGIQGVLLGVSGLFAAGYLIFSNFAPPTRSTPIISLSCLGYCYILAAWTGQSTLRSDIGVIPAYITYGIFLGVSIVCIVGLISAIRSQKRKGSLDIYKGH